MSTIAVGKGKATIVRDDGVCCLECDIIKLRHERKQTEGALKVLFELLEQYAPAWYGEEHHKMAVAAFSEIRSPNV